MFVGTFIALLAAASAEPPQTTPTTATAASAVPPPQTPTQRGLVESALAAAIAASAQAEPSVLALFSEPSLRSWLAHFDDGSGLQHRAPEELVRAFWEELGAAELVHSFGDPLASRSANCGFDLSIDDGMASQTFWNQWQLQALGMVPVDVANNVFTEWSETELFGFPPFANTSAPDLATATDRPFYAALNMYRGAGGNPQCGPVSVVLSRTYLAQQILAAPLDTGFFQVRSRRRPPPSLPFRALL